MSRDGLSICAHFQGQKNVTDLLTDGFKLNLHLSERQSKTESRVIRFCWPSLKMEVVNVFEKSVHIYQYIWCHIL